jgi:hypothetical protein
VCRPYNTSIQTDHRLVLCRFMVPAVKPIWEQANYVSPHMSIKGKLRQLDLRPSADVQLLYQDRLSLALVDVQPGWKTTERVMQNATLAALNHMDQVAQDT